MARLEWIRGLVNHPNALSSGKSLPITAAQASYTGFSLTYETRLSKASQEPACRNCEAFSGSPGRLVKISPLAAQRQAHCLQRGYPESLHGASSLLDRWPGRRLSHWNHHADMIFPRLENVQVSKDFACGVLTGHGLTINNKCFPIDGQVTCEQDPSPAPTFTTHPDEKLQVQDASAMNACAKFNV